jgi:aminoglycoside 6'-N-acetyltransferase
MVSLAYAFRPMPAADLPMVRRRLEDPDPDNVRAIRAYEKAGFYRNCPVDTPDGRALLMVRNA